MGFKNHNPGSPCCTSIPAGYIHCSPCALPPASLTLNWYYWQVHNGGTYGTTYTAVGPIATPLVYQGGTGPNYAWASGWFAGPGDSGACNPGVYSEQHGGYILGSQCCFMEFDLSCNASQGTNLSIGLSSDSMGRLAPDGKAHCYDGTVSARVGPMSFTCDLLLISIKCGGYGGTPSTTNPDGCYVGYLFESGIITP